MLHGVWIAVFAIVLIGVIEMVPMAGARRAARRRRRCSWSSRPTSATARTHGELPIYVVTLLGVVALNLLEGVLIGLALAAVMLVWRAVQSRPRLDGPDGGPKELVVEGSLSFLAVPRLSRELNAIPAGTDVTVRLVTDYLDHAAYDHLQAWQARHRATGATVEVIEPADAQQSARRTSAIGGVQYATWSQWQAGHELDAARTARSWPGSRPTTSARADEHPTDDVRSWPPASRRPR